MLGSLLFLVIKKYDLGKFTLFLIFIIFKFKLWNTLLSQMIKIMKRHHFHHFGEKNLDGKNSWIFETTPHNTYNFIMQNISSF